MITVSAPGKIHLMGEHAVVYGKPALLTAVNIRLRVSMSAGPAHIDAPPEAAAYIAHAMDVVRQEYKLEHLPPLTVSVQSDIPFGYHLGSSAALAVATVGATMYAVKKVWNPMVINQLAYEVEKKQHGNPSGGDNTAVTFGGLLWFRRELEFLKSMWQLPFRPDPTVNHFFLINTGKPVETTGEMVALVRENRLKHKAHMEALFTENEEQVRAITVAIKEGDEQIVLNSLRLGEKTLEGMGVVSKKVVPLIRAIEKAGGAAKILGGGGKSAGVGFLLCYHHDKEEIARLCEPYTFSIRDITLGEEGVRLEEKEL